MDAAERNGYIGGHSAAMARAAVRSGLRNGLRSPRPLPYFSTRSAPRGTRPRSSRGQRQPGKAGSAAEAGQPERAGLSAGGPADEGSRPPAHGAGRAQPVAAADDLARGAAAALHDAGYRASDHTQDSVYCPEGYKIQAAPNGGIIIRHVAAVRAVEGIKPSQWARRMLGEYAGTLRRAGFGVTGGVPGAILAIVGSVGIGQATEFSPVPPRSQLECSPGPAGGTPAIVGVDGLVSQRCQLADRARLPSPRHSGQQNPLHGREPTIRWPRPPRAGLAEGSPDGSDTLAADLTPGQGWAHLSRGPS